MNGAKQFDRWAACCFAVMFLVVAVAGMWMNNAAIAEFGKLGFATFSGVVITLLNRELLGTNGSNGSNGNGSGNENPTQGH